MKYIILITCFAVLIKPVIFILSLLPTRLFITIESKRKKNTNKEKDDGNGQPEVTLSMRKQTLKIIYHQVYGYCRYSLFKVGMLPSHMVRNFLYRHVYLVSMHKNAVLYFGSEIRAPYNLSIGEGSIIGDNAILMLEMVYLSVETWI
jgi:hypothetical protein